MISQYFAISFLLTVQMREKENKILQTADTKNSLNGNLQEQVFFLHHIYLCSMYCKNKKIISYTRFIKTFANRNQTHRRVLLLSSN